MPKKKLTKKEQDTLWTLINYPMLNDNAIARRIHLKLSTVTAIRRRLSHNGYFRTVNIPNFLRLGFELLTVEYGTFNEAIPLDHRIENFKSYVEHRPSTVFAMMSRSNGFLLNVEKNYAQANRHYEELEMFFTSHHLTESDGWKRIIFPFETSVFWNFFDFSPVLRYSYNIRRKENLSDFLPDKRHDPARLSKKEKQVLLGLVKYPEEPDNQIADLCGASRQAVSTIKRRFIRENLLFTRRVMNFKQTGCRLLSFGHTVFGPKAPFDSRKNGLDYTKKIAPVFLGISSNFENILFAATLNYPEFDNIRDKLLTYYKTHHSMAKSPEILLYTVEDICFFQGLEFGRLFEDRIRPKAG